MLEDRGDSVLVALADPLDLFALLLRFHLLSLLHLYLLRILPAPWGRLILLVHLDLLFQ